ncbi:hypothetical protein HQ584_06500 [Patescibacteria group bacterium]|nr:hypothetical protein [Patescibacteria group bacterium]
MDVKERFNEIYFGPMGIFTGIALCRDRRCITSTLILAYAAIDGLSFLNPDVDVECIRYKDRFIAWVNRYLNPKQLGCPANDLYYARCGLLHDLTAESRGSQKGIARPLCYAWGNVQPLTENQMSQIAKGRKVIMIHVDRLLDLLIQGTEVFRDEVLKNTQKSKILSERLDKIHVDVLVK